MKSLQGHFLAAAPHQLDPDFVEAVMVSTTLGSLALMAEMAKKRRAK